MNILIRLLELKDAVSIHALSHQLGYELPIGITTDHVRQVIERPEDRAFVALQEGNVIGWIHAFKAIRLESQPFIEIGGLVVDEAYRGKGVGSLLVQQIKNWCEEMICPSLRVRCQVKRTEAHQFYRSLGFTEQKEQKVFVMDIK